MTPPVINNEIGLVWFKLVPSEVGGKSLIVTGQRDGHELQHLFHNRDLPFNFTVFLVGTGQFLLTLIS